MAIKVNNTTVIDNNKRAEFGVVNFGTYTQEELEALAIVGTGPNDFVYNSTKNKIVFWDGEGWGSGGLGEFTNGILLEDSSFSYYVFLQPGSFTIDASLEAEALLVAGGGGGGSGYYGGGGGAGGIIHVFDTYEWQDGLYQVEVGGGGARGTGSQPGGKGEDTSVTYQNTPFLTAKGGGGGGGRNSSALPGGSGGGCGLPTGGTAGIQPSTPQAIDTSSYRQYGYPGYNVAYGSGGGGASEAGRPGPQTYRPTPSGGNGQSFLGFPVQTISDAIPVANRPAWITSVNNNTFGGGGGGGAYPAPRAYVGGTGGGGNGAQPGISPEAGVDYTGGGGGGAYGAGAAGSVGGSGIFILKIPK